MRFQLFFTAMINDFQAVYNEPLRARRVASSEGLKKTLRMLFFTPSFVTRHKS